MHPGSASCFHGGVIHRNSTLAGLEAPLLLVDNIDPAFTAHHTAGPVPILERAKGISDFHDSCSLFVEFSGLQTGSRNGGRDWVRTSDPYDVNVVLYH